MNDYFNIYFIKCFSSVHQFSAFLSWRAMPCVPLTQMFPSYLKSQNPTYQPYLSSPPSLKQQLCQMCYQRAHISQELDVPQDPNTLINQEALSNQTCHDQWAPRGPQGSTARKRPLHLEPLHITSSRTPTSETLSSDYWIWKWLLTTVTQNYDVQCSSL